MKGNCQLRVWHPFHRFDAIGTFGELSQKPKVFPNY
jgi:hypothetical protein